MTFFYVGSGEFFRFFLLRAQVFRTHLTYKQQNKRSHNRLREEETEEEEEDKEEEKKQQRHVFALLLLDFDDFNAF